MTKGDAFGVSGDNSDFREIQDAAITITSVPEEREERDRAYAFVPVVFYVGIWSVSLKIHASRLKDRDNARLKVSRMNTAESRLRDRYF